MRPIKIKMTAFGPYKDTETVDFEKLSDRNLFLITGPTGAGKTTIFDAITYALYGSGNGDERKPVNFKSDFSSKETVTEVDFEFKLSNRDYRIIRAPAQKVKKKRGEGYKEETEKVVLSYKSSSGKTVVLDKIREVNEEIENILKLTVKQFRQIMMIPQGQFREVITSDTNAREEILKALFDTERYTLIQNHLKSKKKEIENKMDSSNDYINLELKKLEINVDEKTTKESIACVKERMRVFKKQIEEKDEVLEKLDKKYKAISQEIIESEQLNQLFLKLEEDRKALLKLEEKSREYKEKKDRLLKLQKSASLLNEENSCLELEDNFLKLKRSLEKDLEELEILKVKKEEAEKQFAEEENKSKKREDYRKKLESLRESESMALELENKEKAIEEEKARLKKVIEAADALSVKVEKRKEKIEQLSEKIESSSNHGLELEKLNNKKEQLTIKIEKIRNAYALSGKIDQCSELIQTKEKDLTESTAYLEKLEMDYSLKEAEFEALYDKFLNNTAILLAENLKSGKSCPVCGSSDHPKIAKGTKSDISQEDIKLKKEQLRDFRKKVKEAEKCKSEKEKQLSSSINQRQSFFERLEEYLKELELEKESIKESGIALKEEIKVLEKRESQLKSQVENLELDKKNLKDLKDSQVKDENALNEKNLEKNSLSGSAAIEEAKANEKRDRLKQILEAEFTDYRNFKLSLEEAERRYKELKMKYENSKDAKESLERETIESSASVKAKTAQAEEADIYKSKKIGEFELHIKEAGFKDRDDYFAYKLQIKDIEPLKADIESYFDKIKELDSMIEVNEELTKDKEKADVEKLRDREAEIEKSREIEQEEKTKLYSELSNHERVIESVEKTYENVGCLEEEYSIIAELSAVSNAEKGSINSMNMSFERYVLSSFLEDILESTNQRFKSMTDGRFEIIRKERLDHKGRAGGLDLEVMDYYTGTKRDITTLSGGEGFKASLSMALGLSDVVKAYAGGIELDTIFIDEGFGTLDSDSLEVAMNTLIDLQNTGRLVGIISHVDELKERIDAKIVVESSKSGSRIRDFENLV